MRVPFTEALVADPPNTDPTRRGVLTAAGLLPLTLAGCSGADASSSAAALSQRSTGPRSVAAAAMRPLVSSRPGRYAVSYVTFTDLAPSYLTLHECWNALGLDDAGRVYITWTSTRKDGRQDTALFRYTRSTGKREFLGTYIDAATVDGNIKHGEEIPKGHTRIVQVGRKMYMASQGFHDFKGAITTLPQYRGSHLFTYDLDKGVLKDTSAALPGGVLIPHQGIVSLGYSPEHHVLVGLSHPLGSLVLIDPATCRVTRTVAGIPWALNKVVSREIVVTKTGKVYTYRGPEDPDLREQTNEVWVYDLATGAMKRTGTHLKGGFWNGQVQTKGRDKIYLSTVSGNLYQLDVASGRFTSKGYFIDPADYTGPKKYRVNYLYGISLSAAEDSVTGIPIIAATTGSSQPDIARMTAYSVTRKTFTKYADQTVAVFTGSDHRDAAGYVYQAAFDWDHNCHLAVLKPV
jgi:hypothetical protein